MGRAARRHHAERLKAEAYRRAKGQGLGWRLTQRYIGIVAETPKSYKCSCCCNQRQWLGPTRQELLATIEE